MKKKILKVLAAIILLFIAAHFINIKLYSLKNPVFIKNCREEVIPSRAGSDKFTQIYYITAKNDKDKVKQITFKELPGVNFTTDDIQTGQYKTGLNVMHVVNLYNNEYISNDALEGTVLSNAEIEFESGKTIKEDLGELHLYKYEETDSLIDILCYKNDTDGASSMECKVKDNVKITSIESPILDKAEGIFSYEVNAEGFNEETKIYDVDEKGIMYVQPYINFRAIYNSNDLLNYFTFYDICPKVYLTNKNNYRYSFRTHNMSNRDRIEYADKHEIHKFLKVIGEI